MAQSRPWLFFLVVFGAAYAVLLTPWPGMRAAYTRYFCGFGAAFFAQDGVHGLVRFRPAENPVRPDLDAEVIFALPGNDLGTTVGLDSRGLGWVPTALVAALIVASPVPWRRRLAAVVAALVLMQGYVLLVIFAALWNESHGALPVASLPFFPRLATMLDETLVEQLGASFVIPVILWFALTFRPSDWARWCDRGRGEAVFSAPRSAAASARAEVVTRA